MLAHRNPYIESAYKQLQIISQDSEKRMEYESRAKAIRDYHEGLLYTINQREQNKPKHCWLSFPRMTKL